MTSLLNSSEHYGKAGLIEHTKKEIIPVSKTRTEYIETSESKVTPVKKSTYVQGHGVVEYTDHVVT